MKQLRKEQPNKRRSDPLFIKSRKVDDFDLRVDLLRKLRFEFPMIDSGNEIESQAKSFASIAISIRNDLESLKHADDIFIDSSFAR